MRPKDTGQLRLAKRFAKAWCAQQLLQVETCWFTDEIGLNEKEASAFTDEVRRIGNGLKQQVPVNNYNAVTIVSGCLSKEPEVTVTPIEGGEK